MRQIVIFAAVLLLICGVVARFTDHALNEHPAQPQAAAAEVVDQPRQAVGGQHTMVLSSDRAGHFQIEARVDGRSIDFVVNTGATLVIMRESSAAQIQIFPRSSDYTARVSTANGAIKAAPTKIDRIEVGDITVFDVPALILPDEALGQNLLGVSFLSRLRRYEYADGRMVLEQ
jgi:aspartyl protease family protein